MTRGTKSLTGLVLLLTIGILGGCGGASKNSKEPTSADQQEPAPIEVYNHYMGEAGIAVSEERKDDALSYYLGAAEAFSSKGEENPLEGDAHYEAAAIAYQLGDRALAVEEYQKAVDVLIRYSGNSQIKAAVALTNMGAIFKGMDKKNRARTAWQQALKIFQEAPQSHQNVVHAQQVQQNLYELDNGQ